MPCILPQFSSYESRNFQLEPLYLEKYLIIASQKEWHGPSTFISVVLYLHNLLLYLYNLEYLALEGRQKLVLLSKLTFDNWPL